MAGPSPRESKMANKTVLSLVKAKLTRFFAWWGRELASLVPAPVRYWYFGKGNILAVRIENSHALFLLPKAGALHEVADLSFAESSPAERKNAITHKLAQITRGKTFQIFLCLPPGQALRKQIRLPSAVEENLKQTLEFELDRQTPFKADQVYFDYRIIERLPSEQHLLVELAVVPKDAVEQHVGGAAEIGLSVRGVVLEEDLVADRERVMNFLPALTTQASSNHRRWLNFGFFVLAIVLLISAMALPLWKKRTTAIMLNELMEDAKAASRRTESLRAQLDSLVTEHNFTTSQKTSQLATFTLITQLSKLLPDDTWLSQFDVTGSEIQLQGETGSSSKLMEIMENSGFLKGTSYKSPLTQIPGTAVERFHIVATSKPQPLITPSAAPAVDMPADTDAQKSFTQPATNPDKP